MADSGDPDEIHRQIKKLGPRQKEWEELGPQQRRSVTQGLYDDLKKMAVCRGVDPVRLEDFMYLLRSKTGFCPETINFGY